MIKRSTKVPFIKTKDYLIYMTYIRHKSYGTKNSLKYFIGYNDGVMRQLCIKLPNNQIIGYVKQTMYSNKTMSSKVSDNKLLKKYNKI